MPSTNPRLTNKPSKIRDVKLTKSAHVHAAVFLAAGAAQGPVRYCKPMNKETFSVRLDRSAKVRLQNLAKSTGRSRAFLAAEAISAYLDTNEWQVAVVSDFLGVASKSSVPIDTPLRDRKRAVSARRKHSVEEVSRALASHIAQIRFHRLCKQPVAFPSPPSGSEKITRPDDGPALLRLPLSAKHSKLTAHLINFPVRLAFWIGQPLLKLGWIVAQLKKALGLVAKMILLRLLLPFSALRPNVKCIFITDDDVQKGVRVVASGKMVDCGCI